ncbi:MAG: type II secretion system F family protein [Magnetospirillum sp.]|nr:type II secretion system F family protein [Magnetospirillum sp.]
MSAIQLSPEDVVAAAGFVGVVIAALGYHSVRTAMANSPRARMRQRVQSTVAEVAPSVRASVAQDGALTLKQHRMAADNGIAKLLARITAQAEHMGGTAGLRWIAVAAAGTVALAITACLFAKLSVWLSLALVPTAGAVAAAAAYRFLVVRYRTRFLALLPDALDLVIRAVRAGVPVVQAIITAGRELPDPAGREFRIMGDALRLGLEQQEVMDAASRRIGLPDFRFFVVCLQLQRETGGPLADTLENLAGIIRARRELRLKTRALTAQGRTAAKIIAAIPVVTMAALNSMSADYLDPLFTTEKGHTILWLAAGMVTVGLVIINRMSRLED